VIAALGLTTGAAIALAADHGTVDRPDTFGDAATSPLEDLNLKRVEIPDVLKRAVTNPYDLDGMDSCERLAEEIGRIDAALGPDLDEPPPPKKGGRGQKLGEQAHSAAVAAVREKAHRLIPFRGWVRQLTGAERHERAVQAAIRAGNIRRGYLKGVGMRMDCAPPAAPSWFHPRRPEHGFDFFAQLWARVVAWFRSWWPF
jgi:hypothetical protein